MSSFPSFPEFFHALWDHDPYPWQITLAESARSGAWPAWISVPTGAGKTATLDIAIYTLARQAADPLQPRHAPARIVFAVNRRIVVDEAFDRAREIAEKLSAASRIPDSSLHPVSSALIHLAGDGALNPLETFPLRGGTYTDNSWARTPLQPTVITTTLDQLGSRLLFRGYGVSDRACPIHAALLANDALLILDEAHTANAFSETLSSIEEFRKTATQEISTPFAVVQLTATPPSDAPKLFRLTDADRDPVHCEQLVKRLRASKPVTLPESPVPAKSFAKYLADQAASYLEDGHRRILVVLNRVATADDVRSALKNHYGKKDSPAVELLTGRLRPLDRDKLIHKLVTDHQIKSSNPSLDVAPLILVATQCVEVGADYDFDALVTELAPLDALRQRFGRLNRSGRLASSPAMIAPPDSALKDCKPDPLYGSSLPEVWKWLKSIPEPIDFGIDALDSHLPTGELLEHCLTPSAPSPVLLPAHLDLLCQTSPRPHVEPEVACFIHGMEEPLPSVSVLLRDDLWFDENGIWKPAPDAREKLAAAPPLGTELAQIPLSHARRWLSGDLQADDSGDTFEAAAPLGKGENNPTFREIPVFRFSKSVRNPDDEMLPVAGQPRNFLRPGDTLVVHPTLEVARLFPIPDVEKLPDDQYELAHLTARDKVRIRLTPERLKRLAENFAQGLQLVAECISREIEGDPESIDPKKLIDVLPDLAKRLADDGDPLWKSATKVSKDSWKASPYGENGYLLQSSERVHVTNWPVEPEQLGSQTPFSDGRVTLADHSNDVESRARKFSSALPQELSEPIATSARWHDVGKADPRFQSLLRAAGELLAKSAKPMGRSEFLALRHAVGLPDGFRHELRSAVAFLEQPDPCDDGSTDLIAHLIASHHGYCRPFAPVFSDPDSIGFCLQLGDQEIDCTPSPLPLARLSDGVPERFWKLTRQFGWWGLPYLELMVRLADQFESAKTSPSRS